ncbi:MAG TPA: amidohydrolase family protein [Longimicrobiales bacterium]|nr:amidohydrolase family protein [Longimicrobiales bacterium]
MAPLRISRGILLPALFVALPAGACAQSTGDGPPPPGTADMAFVGVDVVPMDTEEVLPDRTVLVEGGRITWIGEAGVALPEGTRTIEADGMFLMPGLAEMHAHVPPQAGQGEFTDQILFLFLANGITTIRGMLGAPHHLPLRDSLDAGTKLGPRLVTTGPSLNGNSVPTPQAAREAVEAQAAAGYDLLKIHPGIGRETFDTLAATAQRVGIRFAGHVPSDVGVRRYLELGGWTIDHLDGYVNALLTEDAPDPAFFGTNTMAYVDESGLEELVRLTAEAGVAQVPTQSLIEDLVGEANVDALYRRDDVRYMVPGVRANWGQQVAAIRGSTSQEELDAFVDLRRRLIKALHDAGVPILLGSDAPQIFNVPGFSMHEELAALVAAGLTPYQALRTGTVNVADHLGAADRGVVAEGMAADLVLLRANPLEDVANVGEVAGVMIQGRWLGADEIASGLEAIAEANRSSAPEAP